MEKKMNKSKTYILASASPRRIEMMRSRGIDPIIHPANIEENIPPEHGMCQTVMFLALKKAKAVEDEYLGEAKASGAGSDEYLKETKASCAGSDECTEETKASCASAAGDPPIIIAADTIVYKDQIMGKPRDRADAHRMLSSLAGDKHYVVTGCALIEAGMQNARVFAEVTEVFVEALSEEELIAYIDTDEPYDKAGGYAIQGLFAKHIARIEGDYDNVVGFPWARIEKELELL